MPVDVESTQGVGGASGATTATAEATTPSTTTADPTPIELSDESFVKVPGVEKPVKFGQHYRGLQSQFTRASQEAARLREQNAKFQQTIQEREQRLAALEQARQGQGTGQPDQSAELLDRLKQTPYLTGQDAAAVVGTVLTQFKGVAQALQQRDQAIWLMFNRMQQLEQGITGVQSRFTDTDFDGKIKRFVSELGLPSEATDLAREIYLAYEGDDLDAEFPTILQNRWEQVLNAARATDRARVEAAKRRNPLLPGSGGTGTPGAALRQGYRSPADIADAFWPGASELT